MPDLEGKKGKIPGRHEQTLNSADYQLLAMSALGQKQTCPVMSQDDFSLVAELGSRIVELPLKCHRDAMRG